MKRYFAYEKHSFNVSVCCDRRRAQVYVVGIIKTNFFARCCHQRDSGKILYFSQPSHNTHTHRLNINVLETMRVRIKVAQNVINHI